MRRSTALVALVAGYVAGAPATASALASRLVGERVPVLERLRVTEEPAGRALATLEAPESFKVDRLSQSGKYAHGFAYGEANRHGWVLTAGLSGARR